MIWTASEKYLPGVVPKERLNMLVKALCVE
jgi:hypothetical protein